MEADSDDERAITNLLIDQIEFADVILLAKVDLISEEKKESIKAILTFLNPQPLSLSPLNPRFP